VKTSQFSFDLPQELVAQEPTGERGASRLLVLNRDGGALEHRSVREIAGLVRPGTVMVFNDTRVRKARVFGRSSGGGLHEFLLLRRVEPAVWEVLAGRARRARPGARFQFAGGVSGTVVEGAEDAQTRLVKFEPGIDDAWLELNGHVPLPPYIRRGDTPKDEERYQTVFSRTPGSAAAPTAGLHFTREILGELEARGVLLRHVTLRVGLGTFLPIRTEEIEDHAMHEESYSVPGETKVAVDEAAASGRPVLAVGTTVVRTLESAWDQAGLRGGEGATRLFIRPGYQFKVVKELLTNFHTPASSLLVLVSAFSGRETILRAYEEAVRLRYRFFSYGDAMLIR
jgi:S-adenosylmethionine:tRNA ribosyltransferase-isomerase